MAQTTTTLRGYAAPPRWYAALLAIGVGLLVLLPVRAIAAPGVAPALPFLVGFATASEERVSEFDVTLDLQPDGAVVITERLTQVFPAGAERHGITRDIKVRAGYQDREDVYRLYRLTDLSVTSPSGAPSDVSREDYGAFVHLRIGSPDETVSGTQTYVLTYRLENVVNEIDATHAEFVHDVVGLANEQIYDEITARVSFPGGDPLQVACNYGPSGSSSLCQATSGNPATFAHANLAPGEALSVAVSMDRAAFVGLAPELIEGSTDNEGSGSVVTPVVAHRLGLLTAGLGMFFPVLAIALMSILVWTRGRDEAYAGLTPGLAPVAGEPAPIVRQSRPGTVAVQFNPPPGVQPGMIGTLVDEQANTVDVTATILDLAVRGYLTITETTKSFGRTDWLLTRTEPVAAPRALSEYEAMLLDGLFASGSPVPLSDLKNTFAATLASVKGSMYDEVVRRGWFRRSPQSQRASWSGLGMLLIFLGAICAFFLGQSIPTGSPISGVPLSGTTILGAGLAVSGVIVNVLAQRMASRTADGTAMLAQSLGFKKYLVTAEANQIKFEEAQQIFSAYLPYAIVFGVADKWANTFDEVAAAAAAAGVTMASPVWYIGPNFGQGGFFDSIASGADSFSTQAAGTFVSTAGSSGSSVFSGGGGGFSGGGGSGSSGGTW